MKHVGRSLPGVPTAVVLLWASVAVLAPAARAQTAGSIVGRVTDSSGSPLAGVTVEATDLIQQSTSVATTGADGRFWFTATPPYTALPPGVYEVRAMQSGFRPANKFVTVSLDRGTTVSFSLEPAAGGSVAVPKVKPLVDTHPPPTTNVATTQTTGSIAGRVTDSSGSPLAGVTVEATSPSLPGNPFARTSAEGRFWFPAMPAGTYEVRAKLSGFLLVKKSVTVSVGKGTTVAFSLEPAVEGSVAVAGAAPPVMAPTATVAVPPTTGSITGQVFDSSGAALSGVTVETTGPGLQGIRVATTGGDGKFSFLAMPVGAYEVRAKLSGLPPVKKSVTVSLDKGTTVAFSLESAAKESVAVSRVAPVVRTPALTVATAESTGSIVGRVRDSSGAALPGVTVETTGPGLQGIRVATTGGDGSFSFPAVPPGVYEVSAKLPGFRPVKKSVTVSLDTGTTVALSLEPAAKESVAVSRVAPVVRTPALTVATARTKGIVGRVRDASGSALPGVTIEVTGPSLQGTSVATTGSDGSFSFPAMRPGAYEVTAKLSGFRPVKKSVTVSLDTGTMVAFSLQVAVEETVVVSAVAPPIVEKVPTPVPVTTTTVANAPSSPAWGRVSLFAQGLSTPSASGGSRQTSGTFWGGITLRPPGGEQGGFDYGFDARAWQDTVANTNTRVSLYEAYVGGRTKDNVLGLWAGQMWLSELGGLGSFGGLLVGASPKSAGPLGRFRFSLFSGVEPKVLEVGYLRDVRKSGGFLTLDGEHGRHHAVGYVLVSNAGLKERSVITMNNFIPIGTRFFLYQAGEYDLIPPGGLGKPGLNYIFANMRFVPVRRVELQGSYHHGLSIDARTLTDNQLNGRPIDPRLLDGFLFESLGGRVSVDVVSTLRVYAGYAREKGNNQDQTANRVTLGLYASDVLRSGFDLTVADNRISHLTGSSGDFNSWYGSLGRSIGRSVYLTVEYDTSVSIIRFTDSGGVIVESQPKTRRYALSGVVHISRPISLLLTLEDLRDDTTNQERGLLGLTYRF